MNYLVRQGTATIAISGTSASGTEIINGELGAMIVSVPALTGTGTVTIEGTTPLGGTMYAQTTQTEAGVAQIHPSGTPTFFSGSLHLTVGETSGTQDAAADIVYNIYYRSLYQKKIN